MRAWWWTLVTAHLVWGNPEHFKDTFGKTQHIETNLLTGDKEHSGTVFNPNNFYVRILGPKESEEREKKQRGFHSWGGKRYEEEDEIRDNVDAEESFQSDDPDKEDLKSFVSFYIFPNSSHLRTNEHDDSLREALTKRINQNPSFSSWGGKRDPEILNLSKKSDFYRLFQQNDFDSKVEQSRKRYPSFNSWAGKRATAFTSWGGKRDNSIDLNDINKNKENLKNVTDESEEFYNNQNSISEPPEENLSLEESKEDFGYENDKSISKMFKNKRLSPSLRSNFKSSVQDQTLKRGAAFNSWGGKRVPASDQTEGNRIYFRNGWMVKKPAAFNSWAGKRAAAFNSWGGKRAAAFNSWGGKRGAAFNSWGGKRAAAFNSWGGKRAAAFNSWGGKRAAAFNSWGGKRAAAFNSWGGKRAAAFNSWGGKRAAAFNSWGGKRAAAFNSWGGKRDAAFNSWGGKRINEKWKEGFKFNHPSFSREGDSHLRDPPILNNEENTSDAGPNEISEFNDKFNDNEDYEKYMATHPKQMDIGKNLNFPIDLPTILKNVEYDNQVKDAQPDYVENFVHDERLTKRSKPSFSSWAGKRSPLFSSWYGNKMPTVLLTNGKRRPAFSSWGGKRSEYRTDLEDCSPLNENANSVKSAANLELSDEINPTLPSTDQNTYKRKKRELQCSNDEINTVLVNKNPCRNKRSSGNMFKNQVFTRMMLQSGFTWPLAVKSIPRGKEFYAWGGKRSL